MTKYIKLSPASTIFYSHTLKLKILKGMKVELTDNLKDNPIIRRALSNGHLVVEEVEDPKVVEDNEVEDTNPVEDQEVDQEGDDQGEEVEDPKVVDDNEVEDTNPVEDQEVDQDGDDQGEEVEDPSDEVADLIQKAKEMYEGGQSVKSISKAFTFDQLSQMLAFYEFTVDESDNNLSLTKVLVEQFKL